MGSSLSPALTNFFAGFHEQQLFICIINPLYVDDMFCVFDSEEQLEVLHELLNDLHLVLRFTCIKENNLALPFLDVLVHRLNTCFLTSVYCKSTFTESYTH